MYPKVPPTPILDYWAVYLEIPLLAPIRRLSIRAPGEVGAPRAPIPAFRRRRLGSPLRLAIAPDLNASD